jgi:hypothetical protein
MAKGWTSRWKRSVAATPTSVQIALVFDVGGNCVGDNCVDVPVAVGWEVSARQSDEGMYTTIN